eukprot:4227423-Pyramimonas_sp.AAC.1
MGFTAGAQPPHQAGPPQAGIPKTTATPEESPVPMTPPASTRGGLASPSPFPPGQPTPPAPVDGCPTPVAGIQPDVTSGEPEEVPVPMH